MPKLQPRSKNVACIESHWGSGFSPHLTVRHLLQLASELHGFRYIHLTCNTEAELDYNLSLLRRRKGFRVIYMACHGTPGWLELPTIRVSLEDLAERLSRGFENRILHFGSCSTIAVPRSRLNAFMRKAQLSLVLGYRNDVDWTEAASTELLLLDRLQRYASLNAFWKDFSRHYRDLIRLTGLHAMQGV